MTASIIMIIYILVLVNIGMGRIAYNTRLTGMFVCILTLIKYRLDMWNIINLAHVSLIEYIANIDMGHEWNSTRYNNHISMYQ